jgi:hypothetical protein
MSAPSILHQLNHVLNLLVMSKEEIEAYKAKTGVTSVKKALRPNGDPTARLPAILSVRTRNCYLETGVTFFKRAHKLTGKKLLSELLIPETVRLTFDTHYRDLSHNTHATVLAMLGQVYQGCQRAGWVKGPSPVTDELRQHVRAYSEDSGVDQPRFGYQPEDAERIVAAIQEKRSVFALPAAIALRCGLRRDEIAGLKGTDLDMENLKLHIKGKAGREREVDIPVELAVQLNPSRQYLFTPSRSWKQAFYQAVRKTSRRLGITVSGVHRLRANFAQNQYDTLREQGLSDRAARQAVSKDLGHNRVSVTRSYVP